MDFAGWISIFMALIAVATAIVTYAVFRSATDAVVIVYAQPDLQRQSFVNLIVENVDRGRLSQSCRPRGLLPEVRFWGL